LGQTSTGGYSGAHNRGGHRTNSLTKTKEALIPTKRYMGASKKKGREAKGPNMHQGGGGPRQREKGGKSTTGNTTGQMTKSDATSEARGKGGQTQWDSTIKRKTTMIRYGLKKTLLLTLGASRNSSKVVRLEGVSMGRTKKEVTLEKCNQGWQFENFIGVSARRRGKYGGVG